MSDYILAHDLGTSGNKATLYDLKGNLRSSTLYEYPTYYPDTNWVEQDPDDWWKAVCVSTKELISKAGIDSKDIACITFSAQMMGCLPVDRQGKPLRRMIIWADQRAVRQSEFIENSVGMSAVYNTTGHRISPAYSAAKILWVKDNEPEIFNKTFKILHAKDYIIFKLTGQFVTDYSDASGMNLLDISKKTWSEEIIRALGLKSDILPELHASTDIVGKISRDAAVQTGLPEGTPVVAGGGDGSCAAVGAGVVQEGKTYNVIGSSSWIAMATRKPVFDKEMRTFNWVHLDQNLYSPCGSMQTAGYSLNWLKNTLCGLEVQEAQEKNISPYKLIDEAVSISPPGANNLLFLPYLLGERSPRWNPDAQGAFIGLKMTTAKSDIYRSVLEGVAFNLKAIMDVFNETVGIKDIIVIGGGAKGKVWLQILADIWQKKIVVPRYTEEATSMGAAICGGVAMGIFSDFKVIDSFNPGVDVFNPRAEYADLYYRLYNTFNKAYEALVPVYSDLAH